jgi:biotin carboxyl carrier protein
VPPGGSHGPKVTEVLARDTGSYRFSAVHEVRAEITASVWKVVVEEGQMVAE